MRRERTLPSSPFFGIGLIKNTGPDRQHGVRFRKSQKKLLHHPIAHASIIAKSKQFSKLL